MIYVVSGRLGSGKSLDMTRMCVAHLLAGGAVRTNMTLRRDAIERVLGRRLHNYQFGLIDADFDPRLIPTGDHRGTKRQRKTMVVLDEALNWFASESSSATDRKSRWGEWLRQSDKLGQDVFFIAQNFERAAKWIRELAQIAREIVPLRTIKLKGFIPIGWVIPFGARLYMVRVLDVRAKALHALEFHWYNPQLFSCYDTAETYGFRAAGSAYDGMSVPPYHYPIICVRCFALSTILTIAIICGLARLVI